MIGRTGRRVLLVVGGVVLVALFAVVVGYQTMRRGVHYAYPVVLAGRTDTVQVHFQHWFPRARHSFDFTMGGHIWFRDQRPPVTSGGVVQRWQFAHTLIHVAQEEVEGSLRWRARVILEFLFVHPWARRAHEREANNQQQSLTVSGTASVIVHGHAVTLSAPWLMQFDNYAMPPTPKGRIP